jgi:hypothetical protein
MRMLKRYLRHLLVCIALAGAFGATASGFWPTGQSWADGAIIMHLQLGPSSQLSDGCGSWGCAAEAALSIWNGVIQRSKFQVVRDSTVPKNRCDSSGPCDTNVFFASDIYGEAFGSSTLAVTLRRWFSTNNRHFETDTIFNTKFTWDSYRGNIRPGVTDFRRVAIHEFGHSLGLTHPDEHGQSVSAIMNSHVSNIDTLTADDIAGANSLYGNPSGSGGSGRVINFPGRDQTHRFRVSLEPVYRDTLHRGKVFSFADVEGSVVWLQEYLRYRLNGCDHDQATEKVRLQILGAGIQAVCGSAAAGEIAFPVRNDSLRFRLFLEQLYRDVLLRGAVLTFVDIEGDVVWIQEYLLYRLKDCDDAEATRRVLVQISGGGVLPGCSTSAPPPPPGPPPPPAAATMTGRWSGNGQDLGQFTMVLTQNGGTITGTFHHALGNGGLDPAAANTIDGARNVVMRMKISIFNDFTMRGTLNAEGTRVTGTLHGSGFHGEPFSMDRVP